MVPPTASVEPIRTDSIRLRGADGVSIAAEAFGSDGRVPVLFLHGGGQSRSAWVNSARSLASMGYRTLAIDLRGHGDSDWASDGNYALERYAADIDMIVREIGQPAVLVGASLGGQVGLIAAARRPDMVRALALADMTPWVDKQRAGDFRRTIQGWAEGFDTIEAAAAAVSGLRGTRPSGNPQTLRQHMREGVDGRLYWRWDPRFIRDEFTRSDEHGLMEQSAAALRVPTLVMRAELSTLVSLAQIERFRSLVPALIHEEIAGVGHMVTGDDNHVYVPALLRFLEMHGI